MTASVPPPARLQYVLAPDGTPLYTAYHAPNATVAARVPVLLLASFLEERKSAYATLRRLAERLADAGHPVLRFDYPGFGESGGTSAALRLVTLDASIEQMRRALVEFFGQPRHALIGVRFGGLLALTQPQPAALTIAITPVLSGAHQVRLWRMRSKIRQELTADKAGEPTAGTMASGPIADLDGIALSEEFLKDVAGLQATPQGTTVLLQVSPRKDPTAEYNAWVEKAGPAAKIVCVQGEPFWDRLDDVSTASTEDAIIEALSAI